MPRCGICLILNTEKCTVDCMYRDLAETTELRKRFLVILKHSNIDTIYEHLASLDTVEKRRSYLNTRYEVDSEWENDFINGYNAKIVAAQEGYKAEMETTQANHLNAKNDLINNHQQNLKTVEDEKNAVLATLDHEIAVLQAQLTAVRSVGSRPTVEEAMPGRGDH